MRSILKRPLKRTDRSIVKMNFHILIKESAEADR